MRVISTTDVTTMTDRTGSNTGRIAIDIWVDRKDDDGKEYHIWTRDILILDYGLETQRETPIYKIENGSTQRKEYIKTYAEYDSTRVQLDAAYPTELTGSEKEDWLLQSSLLASLSTDPIYGLTGAQWNRV